MNTITLLITFTAPILLALLALRFGHDSRDGVGAGPQGYFGSHR